MYEKGREKTKAENSLSLLCHRYKLSRAPIEILVNDTHLGVGKVEKGVTCVIPAGSGSGLGKTLFRTDSFLFLRPNILLWTGNRLTVAADTEIR